MNWAIEAAVAFVVWGIGTGVALALWRREQRRRKAEVERLKSSMANLRLAGHDAVRLNYAHHAGQGGFAEAHCALNRLRMALEELEAELKDDCRV